MKHEAKFWDGVAAKYARKPVKDVAAYERTLERVRAHLGANDDLLEVGCGTGSTALLLAGDVRRYTASDVSARMIGIACSKAAERRAGDLRFVQAGLLDDTLPRGPFDAVLAFHVLHLVDDLEAGLDAIAGRLRPGGLIVSKTVCLGEMGRHWRLLVATMRLLGLAPPTVAPLTAAGLEGAIARAGFEVVETAFFPQSPPSRFVVARKI